MYKLQSENMYKSFFLFFKISLCRIRTLGKHWVHGIPTSLS